MNSDLVKMAVKMIAPNNDVICDDRGMCSVFVEKTPRTLKELVTGGDSTVHPAFLLNGKQVKRLLIGKYEGIAHGNRIYSLGGVDPTASINLDNYTQYCRNVGKGHHCITAAEWAYLALCCLKDGHLPNGNSSWGKDDTETSVVAIPTTTWTAEDVNKGKTAHVATGSGPVSWSDDGTERGIFDLKGNVWEWVLGIRLVKGELQVIPYNNAADPNCDVGPNSAQWRAINADATGWNDIFVTPTGTGETLNAVKLDWVENHWQWGKTIETQADASHDCAFSAIKMEGLSEFAKMYMLAMALAPDAEADYKSAHVWANNGAAERCAFRGGSFRIGASASVFALNFGFPRSDVRVDVGGRPAFAETDD